MEVVTTLKPEEFSKRDRETVSDIVWDILQARMGHLNETRELSGFSWQIRIDYTLEEENG